MDQEVLQHAAALTQRMNPDGSLPPDIQELLAYLPDCEYELISFMVAKNVWQGFIPSPPPNYIPGDGSVELGLFLYWLSKPWLIDLSMFTQYQRWEIEAILYTIGTTLAPTQMTDTNAAYFNSKSLIYTDGSVLSSEKYATYDQGWLIAFFNLLESMFRDLWYNNGIFPTTEPPVIQLSGKIPGTVKIALLGDCGTGDETLASIMKNIMAQDPDYIIHLGDVYYAGTPQSNTPNGQYYFWSGEEADNMLQYWPPRHRGKSFTLNSNHEMYSGANGYFTDALNAANRGAGSIFKAQQGSSCFALKFGDWTILGLDSAFLSSSFNAFMTGSIGGANGTQGQWIQSLHPDPSKTIVMTHHNGFADDCSSVYPLWAEINGSLNGDPYAWYWGHVHNALVYKSPLTIPANGTQPPFTTRTYARCLGHAALPYGLSPALNNKPILWHEKNLQPAPSKQLYNGFGILTLSLNGVNQVNNIQEQFYDLSSASAVFSNNVFPSR